MKPVQRARRKRSRTHRTVSRMTKRKWGCQLGCTPAIVINSRGYFGVARGETEYDRKVHEERDFVLEGEREIDRKHIGAIT